ncbi:hypothetical protein MOK15_21020 [Sphingobium sp. BYY-5]|uniref:hypothetical protein n=1 Tax=Sphingobium sp. BYY-5 TaxID=2926400 RepID=UPI001FA6D340|nr:hypothetical protein [Sphingobium sp. BYY-5]MCI4592544.1 hypothetical protein [Sphingobium sp. BYY-5]
MQKLIARQPALRLGLLLDDLAEALLIVGIADLRTRKGALLVLEWIDDGFTAPLLPPSVLNAFRPKLRALRLRSVRPSSIHMCGCRKTNWNAIASMPAGRRFFNDSYPAPL